MQDARPLTFLASHALPMLLLGRGAPVFRGIDLSALGYQADHQAAGEGANHLVIAQA
ncbi:hypothetical protein [Tabrizicola sp.]|uniref:hypothetical protein n=1 Tax=Tabrizicola sp. TaxID=2005166 RepID=UPI003F3D5CEC